MSAVKIRDYAAEAIYVFTIEILDLEKLFIIYARALLVVVSNILVLAR